MWTVYILLRIMFSAASYIFHVAEKWKDDHYVTTNFGTNKRVIGRPTHVCSETKETLVLCIDEYGMEHDINFVHCNCEPLAVTLVRAQLWPATPHLPRLVFRFSLLDWIESLMVECQVALRDFCNALYFRCPHSASMRRDIYRSLIDAFEEYRYFKHEIRHLSYLSEDLDSGNRCPACSETSGKVVYSLDALFGLPRKKSAGESFRSPLHGDLFFCDQTEVDEFVINASCGQKDDFKDCNNFLAGNMLRSNSRFRALDETALFGSACRHEFPAIFFNLKHGERLSYAVHMVEALLKRRDEGDIYVTYDIACTLHKHLVKNGRLDILEKIRLCLPSFHSFGHKASCQVTYGPARCEGIGLSDGEVMERMWSYLRRFGRMTKEMRPSHRVDVLTHALVYYGRKKKEKLGAVLVLRWKKAKTINDVAMDTFQKLVSSYEGGPVSMATVQKWILEQSVVVPDDKSSINIIPQWKCQYFLLLQSLFQLRERLSADNTALLDVYLEVSRIDKELKEIESKQHIHSRWSPSDRAYVEVKSMFTKERIYQVAEAMWAASSRRLFLLQLKAKYADGQKIAKKLEGQIRSETLKIKSLIHQYNSCHLALEGQDGKDMLLEEALDPFFLAKQLQPNLLLYSKAKQELIESCLRINRSSEELLLVQQEMRSTLNYYYKVLDEVDNTVTRYSRPFPSEYDRGAVSLLQVHRKAVTVELKKCQDYFSPVLSPSDANFSGNDFVINEDYDEDDDDDDVDITTYTF